MTTEEIFFTLGVEKTKDERAIKDAYRSKLVTTNPEDDPEGFKKLRAAYEEACSYARSQDEEEEHVKSEHDRNVGIAHRIKMSSYHMMGRGFKDYYEKAVAEYEELGDAALKDFYKILERDPADQFAHNNIGCVLKYQGKYEEALPYFQQAFYYMYREGKEEPNAMPPRNTAHTYELMGEYKMAAEVYKWLMDTMDGYKTSYVTNCDISCNYARSGQLDKALAVLDENMKTNHNYNKLKYRACLYAGNWKKAEEMRENFRRQVSILAKDKIGLALYSEHEHMLAWESFRKYRYEDALKYLDSATSVPLSNEQITPKARVDLYINKLFFLTLAITNTLQWIFDLLCISKFLWDRHGLYKESCTGGNRCTHESARR